MHTSPTTEHDYISSSCFCLAFSSSVNKLPKSNKNWNWPNNISLPPCLTLRLSCLKGLIYICFWTNLKPLSIKGVLHIHVIFKYPHVNIKSITARLEMNGLWFTDPCWRILIAASGDSDPVVCSAESSEWVPGIQIRCTNWKLWCGHAATEELNWTLRRPDGYLLIFISLRK